MAYHVEGELFIGNVEEGLFIGYHVEGELFKGYRVEGEVFFNRLSC